MSDIQDEHLQQGENEQQQVDITIQQSGVPSSSVSDVAMAISNEPVVIRVFPHAEANLQALFDAVLNLKSKTPQKLPFRKRQLPKSFFKPPVPGSKTPSKSRSRKNLGDSALGRTAAAVGGRQMPSVTGKKSIPYHSRTRSSPASLQKPYSVEVAKQQQARHARRKSHDVSRAINELGPLPQGWEEARTSEGLIYFLNHQTKTTQWEDPRKSLATQTADQHQCSLEQLLDNINESNTFAITNPTNSSPHMSSTLQKMNTNVTMGCLPDGGWKQDLAVDGETCQFDPRLSMDLEKAPTSDAVLPSELTLLLLKNNDDDSGTSETMFTTRNKLFIHSVNKENIELNQYEEEIVRHALILLDSFQSADDSQQESANSGLDLSNNYPLKDIISVNMENHMTSALDISVNDSQEINTSDDTDDLVPSLELEDGLSSDVLDEVKLSIGSINRNQF